MLAAAKERTELAFAAGNIDSDGVPLTAVIADAAWCKLSFKTNYNALSGVVRLFHACIIGVQAKVISISVRSSYCCICAHSKKKKKSTPSEPACFRNWNTSSPAMEADIKVEGFKSNGDSSVTRQLIKIQPYGSNLCISKVEYTKHILRNYIRRLRDIAVKSKNNGGPVPVSSRAILRLCTAVTKLLGTDHHRRMYLSIYLLKNLEKISTMDHIMFLVTTLRVCKEDTSAKAQKRGKLISYRNSKFLVLIHNVTINSAECFNSIKCKFVVVKRVNFALRSGYQTRSELSVISHNSSGRSLNMIHKKITRSSPGSSAVKMQIRRQNSVPKKQIGKNAIAEVIRPAKAVSLTPQEAFSKNRISFYTLKDGELYLKESHPYMYQVQGQIHIDKHSYT
ncbi:hypothetical protein PR048_020868 [Dryococelus australis]|uniref:Mutator-like transposase domain-containing protein n=1 Tax=Dryococelus australis TaxID=614101 RepID=A0ABQ9GWK8_9NEOP|nr:hypothetical protein PR048_020868 [Dryococelus australis]